MKNRNLGLSLVLLVILTAGCDWRGIRGNGNLKTETRPVTDFTRIVAGGFYEIEWHPGAPSFSITTDENLLGQIETKIDGSVLRIETHSTIAPTHGIKVAVSSSSLSGAELSGALLLNATQLHGDRFTLETSGASKVSLAGQVNRLVASLTGASKLEAEDLKAADVEISVTGAGKAAVFASNSVKAAITGAGKVTYAGNPKTIDKKVAGAGKIEPQD